jgi:hypothetical protein
VIISVIHNIIERGILTFAGLRVLVRRWISSLANANCYPARLRNHRNIRRLGMPGVTSMGNAIFLQDLFHQLTRRQLAKRGREQEAVEVLCAVHDLQPDDPYIVGEIEAIRAAIAIEGKEGSKITALFKKDILQTRRRVILAWFGLFMNQWSGINLVVYYMPTVLVVNVGMGAKQAQLIAGFVELMFVVGNTLPALALDRLGRKRTMMVGCGLLSFCMMMISIVSST